MRRFLASTWLIGWCLAAAFISSANHFSGWDYLYFCAPCGIVAAIGAIVIEHE